MEARDTGSAIVTATSEGKFAQTRVVIPTWLEAPLRSANGNTLPAVVQAYKVTDPQGVELTRTVKAIAGRLRVNPGEQVYEQQLTLERWEQTYVRVNGTPIFTGVQHKETKVFEDHGRAAPAYLGMEMLYSTSEKLPRHVFTGFRTQNGFDVTQRINAFGEPVLLRFAR